jgi:hypothetical protein
LNAGAQPFRTLPIESARKNGHNGEHVANQLFGRLLDLGLIEDFKADMLPLKRLVEIAKPKAYQPVRIFDQDHIDSLLSH